MCTPSTTLTPGCCARMPLTSDRDPPESLIIMRALDIIGYTVSLISERSSRCFASVAVSPTLAASGFENTICGMVSSSSGFGSSPAMDSAAMMPCSNAR